MGVFEYQVICHLFYDKESLDLINRFKQLESDEAFFFFNIHPSNPNKQRLIDLIDQSFKSYIILSIPPKGRDIGAKLQLISLSLQSGIKSKYTLITHDKRSPHLENGEKWREELYRVFSRKGYKKMYQVFSEQSDVGVIGSAKYLQNEFVPETGVFASNSNHLIKKILSRYHIQPSSFDFIAGNIFWIRTNLVEKFFSDRSIADIRADLESGNALDFAKGTFVHSWERVMSWIATCQGKIVYGI